MGIEERKERDKEFRRHQIMDAAKNTFAQKGFSGATIESIAEAADFSPATIYLYFKNKDELYASLSLKILKVLVEKIESIVNQENLAGQRTLIADTQSRNITNGRGLDNIQTS